MLGGRANGKKVFLPSCQIPDCTGERLGSTQKVQNPSTKRTATPSKRGLPHTVAEAKLSLRATTRLEEKRRPKDGIYPPTRTGSSGKRQKGARPVQTSHHGHWVRTAINSKKKRGEGELPEKKGRENEKARREPKGGIDVVKKKKPPTC